MDKPGDVLILFGHPRRIMSVCPGHSEVRIKRGRKWVVELQHSHTVVATDPVDARQETLAAAGLTVPTPPSNPDDQPDDNRNPNGLKYPLDGLNQRQPDRQVDDAEH